MTVNVGSTFGRSLLAKFNLMNSPPSLTTVSNRTISAGIILTITNTATDPDLPYQSLSFNVNGPTNASINPSNGVFSWRPLVAQAGTSNFLSVVVTDNGTPALSATQSFGVVVNHLNSPLVTQTTVNDGQVRLSISGDSGPDYFVQASTNLADWSTILATNQPALPLVWTDTNAPAFPKRFYRVRLGP
jgi:hypothetical protein